VTVYAVQCDSLEGIIQNAQTQMDSELGAETVFMKVYELNDVFTLANKETAFAPPKAKLYQAFG
jgi:hypothetical protein